jgi:hypothetical protein
MSGAFLQTSKWRSASIPEGSGLRLALLINLDGPKGEWRHIVQDLWRAVAYIRGS